MFKMGVNDSKEFNQEFDLFSREEKALLKDSFTTFAKGNMKTTRQSVEIYINQLFAGSQAAQVIARRICDLMTGQIPTNNTVTFDGYIHCAATMIKGMLEDQAVELMYLAKGAKGAVSYDECSFISATLIQLALHIVQKLPEFQSWDGSIVSLSNDISMLRLASALMNDLNGTPKEQDAEVKLDQMTIHKWLSKSSLLNELFSMLSRHIFQFPMTIGKHLLPLCRNLPSKVYPSWLSLPEIMFINSALPSEYQSEWRFLFSSRIHGESFSSLMGNIVEKGPSIVFIKDVDGFIFGGFASVDWTIGPQFKGTRANFVFSLAPEMNIYASTGFNDHYQYLNVQQQTFPNGMGFGGQLEYFAIWIDSEYGKGNCAPTCTTYSCRQLSGKPAFLIDMIEVWAVGPEKVEDEEEQETRPSILDVDVEGTAMLRMMNRGPVSEGMRDNPTSDDPEEKELYVVSP